MGWIERIRGWMARVFAPGPNGSSRLDDRMRRMVAADMAENRDTDHGHDELIDITQKIAEHDRDIARLQEDMGEIRGRLSPYGIEFRARERADAGQR